MKRLSKVGFFGFFLTLLFFGLIVLNSEEIPKAQLPVITTSAGQSPDVTTVNIICEEAGVMYDYCDVVTPEMLKDGVGLGDRKSAPGFHVEVHTDLNKFPKGTPYKTIIIAIGASLKGMGASGLTVETELERLKKVINYCKKNGIFIIGVHIGGSSKRGAPGSDNERMIDAVAPYADYLIVTTDSNKDGRFTEIAKEKGIPLTEVKYALEVVDIFKKVFGTK
ncbi:glycoside hydrolase family 5 protein [SCandidatus Aminicenantes bacterium Aminicenantia_JdfR_composite]|jgi:hypothetical protein|nr:glycoside hydrolase family 5 protein [SCandidatus Aminicenantes bacterium Aminicenantia_JdfR_composite]